MPLNFTPFPLDFYSHTSCEVQLVLFAYMETNRKFLLTHLMRGATMYIKKDGNRFRISTHTPHARCNVYAIIYGFSQTNFYSHTSCEVQQYSNFLIFWKYISTHTPHARCNTIGLEEAIMLGISTHTPHARCNISSICPKSIISDFYSHTSCEVQPQKNTPI